MRRRGATQKMSGFRHKKNTCGRIRSIAPHHDLPGRKAFIAWLMECRGPSSLPPAVPLKCGTGMKNRGRPKDKVKNTGLCNGIKGELEVLFRRDGSISDDAAAHETNAS